MSNIINLVPDYKKSRDRYDAKLEAIKDTVLKSMNLEESQDSVMLRIAILYQVECIIGAQEVDLNAVLKAIFNTITEGDLNELTDLNYRYRTDLDRFLESK